MVKIYVKKVRKLMEDTGMGKIEAMETIPVPKKWWDKVLEALRED